MSERDRFGCIVTDLDTFTNHPHGFFYFYYYLLLTGIVVQVVFAFVICHEIVINEIKLGKFAAELSRTVICDKEIKLIYLYSLCVSVIQ